MELKDTVEGMLSDDYKERFRAEYQQLIIRKNKLDSMLVKLKDGTLDFKPTCPTRVLEEQAKLMEKLMYTMIERAVIEGIMLGDLPGDDEDWCWD